MSKVIDVINQEIEALNAEIKSIDEELERIDSNDAHKFALLEMKYVRIIRFDQMLRFKMRMMEEK